MTVLQWVCSGLLAAGAIMAMIRVVRGPSVLDRAVALDIITSILIMGVALEAAVERRTDTVPVLAALALVGFVASVMVARFVSFEPEEGGRIRSREEVAAEDEAVRQAEEEAARAEAEIAASRDEEEGL